MREPFSHFWEEFLRPRSSWLLPDLPGDPSTVQGGGCCPLPQVSFPHESLQKHNPWCVCGGCIPTPQMTRAKGEEGRCWGSPTQPPSQVLQGGWRAGEGCWLGCVKPALPAGTQLGEPCIPLWHFPEVTWARFGQRWLGRGLTALMLMRAGSTGCIPTPFYLPVFRAATFAWDFSSLSLQAPAWAKGGALQYCPPPSGTATPRWEQAVQGWRLVPPPWAGREGWVRSTPGSGDPMLPHRPTPREAEQGLTTLGCPVTRRAPAAAPESTAAMRGCKVLRKRGAVGMGDFQALAYAAPKAAAARAASTSPASL